MIRSFQDYHGLDESAPGGAGLSGLNHHVRTVRSSPQLDMMHNDSP